MTAARKVSQNPFSTPIGGPVCTTIDTANITLLPLPPKCPELNPVENVWQFMRDNWLSNRIFSSYDDNVDRCCFA